MNLNFFICFAASTSSICSFFSYDADTCLSVFGCGYCLTSNKCISNYPLDENDNEPCRNSGQFINFAHADLGQCFYLLSDDPCSTCASTTSLGSTCGWCESLGACIAGDSRGSYANNCPIDDWKFSKRQCSNSRCAYAKDADHCKSPCVWNDKRQVCHIYRNLSLDTEYEIYNKKQWDISNIIMKFISIIFFISVIAIISVLIWKSQRPLYENLDNLETVSLDDLPPVSK